MRYREIELPDKMLRDTNAFILINAIPIFDKSFGFTRKYLYMRIPPATTQDRK